MIESDTLLLLPWKVRLSYNTNCHRSDSAHHYITHGECSGLQLRV